MTDFIIDFTTIKGNEPIEPQQVRAEIVKATPGTSKTGNPKLDLQWKITETADGENEGRILFDTVSFAPAALWRAKLTLQALGFPSDFQGAIEAEDLIGREAALTVTIEPAAGDYPARNKVARTEPVEKFNPSGLGF